MMGRVHVIGFGLDPNNLPPEHAKRIAHAQMLVGGRRLLDHFKEHPAIKVPIQPPLTDAVYSIRKGVLEKKEVVVLADGDPGFFGIGRRLVATLGREAVVLYPNVTTLQTAASRLKIPWDDIRTVSLHGRKDIQPLLRALVRIDRVAVYTDSSFHPAVVAQELIRREVDTFHMHVCEDLGSVAERIRCFELEKVVEKRFSPLNFIILDRIKRPGHPLCLGLDDEKYLHQDGLITKKEIRAAGLSALEIEPFHTVWDLGAGCGSIAIEASVLAYDGSVHAVDRDPERVRLIRKNIRRTGAYVVETIHGDMPECLDSLPNPDCIFIGGGMGKGNSILEEAVRRLKPGGKIVLHLVLLGSLTRVIGYLSGEKWDFSVKQVHVCRSKNLGFDQRLNALNPVWIVSAAKPSA